MKRLLPLLLLLPFAALAQAVAPPPRPPAVRPVVNAPAFPTPGATPAGAGLPIPGQQPVVQRSKNWRPGGAHPEMMAPDDVPQAVKLVERKLLSFYLPDLEGVPQPGEFAKKCAQEMALALSFVPPEMMRAMQAGSGAMSAAQHPCLAAWLYHLCAERYLPARSEEHDVDAARAIREAHEIATAVCGQHGDTMAVRSVLAAVRRAKGHVH